MLRVSRHIPPLVLPSPLHHRPATPWLQKGSHRSSRPVSKLSQIPLPFTSCLSFKERSSGYFCSVHYCWENVVIVVASHYHHGIFTLSARQRKTTYETTLTGTWETVSSATLPLTYMAYDITYDSSVASHSLSFKNLLVITLKRSNYPATAYLQTCTPKQPSAIVNLKYPVRGVRPCIPVQNLNKVYCIFYFAKRNKKSEEKSQNKDGLRTSKFLNLLSRNK